MVTTYKIRTIQIKTTLTCSDSTNQTGKNVNKMIAKFIYKATFQKHILFTVRKIFALHKYILGLMNIVTHFNKFYFQVNFK
jgi:hypothetical protein